MAVLNTSPAIAGPWNSNVTNQIQNEANEIMPAVVSKLEE